jgi:hypothetical protein
MADFPDPHLDLAGYQLGVLDDASAVAFQRHLAGCSSCQAQAGELSGVVSLLRQSGPEDEPSPDLRERALAGVRQAGARRSRNRWLAAAAAAIVLLVGVGVASTTLPGDSQQAPQVISLVDAGSGNASGTADVRVTEAGAVVDLHVSDLPPSPPGTLYECWFVGPGDTGERPNRVSAGTFLVGSSGSANVQMIAAADLSKFPKMGVTAEPADGNPQRTGPKVLITP